MTNLTDLLPAGAGGKQVSFTASGAISQGNPVALKSDGNVKAISSTGNSETLGSITQFESGDTYYTAATFDSTNNKVVIVYRDNNNSGYGTAVVGTVSGTSISFGTPVVFESATVENISVGFDESSGKIIAIYKDQGNSDYGTFAVGTVSGTSISFGTPDTFYTSAGGVSETDISYIPSEQKMLVTFLRASDGYPFAIVGTVSGTTMTFDTAVQGLSASSSSISLAYDSVAQKHLLVFKNEGSNRGEGQVISVSGNTPSFGSNTNFATGGGPKGTSAAFDSDNGKFVIAYRDTGAAGYGKAIVATISSTSVSFGSAYTFESASIASTNKGIGVAFDTSSGTTSIAYYDVGNSDYGTYVNATISSGTTLSFSSPAVFNSNGTFEMAATFDSNAKKVVFAFQDYISGSQLPGKAIVLQNESSNFSDFIGIADAAISDTASGNITIKGGIAANGLSSLTPGSTYYVQSDGTLSTVSSDVTAGKALSATSINLDYSS